MRRPARSLATVVLTTAVIAAAAVVALPSEPAAAHVPHDRIFSLVASPTFATDDTVYLISRNHLMRSTDGGLNWTPMVRGITGLAFQVAVAPSDPEVLYMAMDGGISRSADRGSSWTRTNTLSTMSGIAHIAISPRSSDVAFATGASTGLFRTTDGGSSWSAAGSFGAMTALSVSATGRVIVGGSDGKVFTSTDDGATWARSSGTPAGEAITAAFDAGSTTFIGTKKGRVFRSADAGRTFSKVGGTGLPADQITSMTVTSDYATDHTVWVADWDFGVYRSTDRGATFAKKSQGLTTNPQAPSLGKPQFGDVVAAADGSGHQVLFEAGYDGLFRSVDRAQHWQEVQTLANYLVGLAVSPDYANDGTVVATTYIKGAYISRDRGNTWNGTNVGLGFTEGQNEFVPIYRLTNVRFSPNYVNDGTIFTAGHTSLLKSTDRGASWTAAQVLPPSATQQLFVVAPSPKYATDDTVYVGSTFGTVFRSNAGGAAGSWTQLGRVDGKVQSFVLNPGYPTDPTLYASTSTGIFKSPDAGAHWTRTGPAVASSLSISPDYAADGTVFAATVSGLYVTRDRGATWTLLTDVPWSSTSHIEAAAVSPEFATDRMVLVSVLGKGLFRSDDAGATFTETGSSLLDDDLLIGDFDNPTASPIQFSPSFATDHTIFGMAQTRIVQSTDGGDTWQPRDLPPASALVESPSVAPAPNPVPVPEGDSGERVMRVAFDLSHPFKTPVSVGWRTVDIANRPDAASSVEGDYLAASGRLVYPAGSTRQYAEITIEGDTRTEADELVAVVLSAPVGMKIAGNLGVGIIGNDDNGP